MKTDDIRVEIIAMHYGIVRGERQRVFPQVRKKKNSILRDLFLQIELL